MRRPACRSTSIGRPGARHKANGRFRCDKSAKQLDERSADVYRAIDRDGTLVDVMLSEYAT